MPAGLIFTAGWCLAPGIKLPNLLGGTLLMLPGGVFVQGGIAVGIIPAWIGFSGTLPI